MSTASADSVSPGGDLPYRLVATDLDGTLLNTAETVSARNRAALAAVTAAGASHIIVTGRSAGWARPVFDEIGYTGIAVCGQGAQVYDAGAHQLLTSLTLDRRLAALAIGKIEAETGTLAVAANQDGLDGQVLAGPGYALLIGADLPMVDVTTDELLSTPVSKLYIQHPTLTDDGLAEIARQVAGDLVGVVMAGPGIVELLPLGLSKATGLAVAARRLGLRAADTIAFGDMPNDIPMFGWAAHGVAMANAHQQLLAVADEVTVSNDEDGVAVVLERLFLGA
ncbi:Cof-type HAD-IIB family hydrolase [Kitasatospora sp. NBC_00240]|jgi:Cof subfamily protein (haloacid dehalogenase superfamily)|uniref:HAD family hydrolase n=1 Tax=Kitasatospora sp. NBC_00240 TaxID=2903567 RepID=UPI002259B0F6|nr:HAD family hydrolase [Kitasatospora sp. NBC_00240]MCX5211580.1 Cof-type HAD-IIB family hydrolase [Kitasatospora sp. NBC_00240]